MNERRRFLHVLTGAVAALGANCTTDVEQTGAGGTGGNGGTGGEGSTGGNGGNGGNGGAGGEMASSSSGMPCTPAGSNVGPAASFPSPGLYKIAGATFLIGLDAGGLYAMSSLCTHQQCNLNSKGAIISGGIHCNCHGAEYDNNGAVTNGPALNPLKHYQLTLECDGNLWVDKAIVVASDQRLMV